MVSDDNNGLSWVEDVLVDLAKIAGRQGLFDGQEAILDAAFVIRTEAQRLECLPGAGEMTRVDQ